MRRLKKVVYKKTDPEICRYRKNWIVIYCMSSLIGIAYFIAIPSLHQYVTSSSHPQDSNVQPGLGLSEMWYSWIVSVSSLGELIGAILMGLLSRWFYVKHLMLVELLVSAVGGILYGIGKAGWMLLIGRFGVGLYQGGQMTILRTYLGETSNTVIAMLPPEEQKKSNIKNTNFFWGFTVATSCVAIGPGLAAIAAEIPHLDQFRWPGYYILIHSAVLAVIVLVFFREKRTALRRRRPSCTVSKLQLTVPVYTIAFLILAFFIINWYFAVAETLLNPILADNFGFTVKYTSYIFLTTLVFFTAGSVLIFILQKCKFDNRAICLIGLFLSISGSIIASDWQAISGDQCDQFSAERNFTSIANSSLSTYCNPSTLSISTHLLLLNSNSTGDENLCNATQSKLASCPIELELNDSCSSMCRTNVNSGRQDLCHNILCWLSKEGKVNESNNLECYVRDDNVCLNVTARTALLTSSGSGSGTDILTSTSLSGEECGELWDEQADMLVLLEMESSDLKYLKAPCFTGKDDLNVPCTKQSCNGSAQCVCEAFSGPPNNCFWNPNSRITGEYCERCTPLCRSTYHSLNFIQLLIGFSFLTPGIPIGRITPSLIVSDAMGSLPQGFVMGIMVASGAVARFTGPLWGNAAYLAVGRRTYLPMSILTAEMAVVTVVFLLLYRSMKPKKTYGVSPEGAREEGRADVEDAVSYDKDSDTVLLLELVDKNEVERDHHQNGISERATDSSLLTTDEAPLLTNDNDFSTED